MTLLPAHFDEVKNLSNVSMTQWQSINSDLDSPFLECGMTIADNEMQEIFPSAKTRSFAQHVLAS